MTQLRRTVIGLDIGGTSTRGLRADGPATTPGPLLQISAEATGGSANTQNVDADTAREQLRAVLSGIGCRDLAPETVVVIGAGGVDTDDDARHLRELVIEAAPELATTRIGVVHDTRLMLAAQGLDAGIAVVAGTGSVAWGRREDGREARRGGWGHLLGDEGSGWWIGREAVRRCLARAEAGLPVDELDAAVLADRGLGERQELIAAFHVAPDRSAWAGLSGAVDRCARAGHDDSRRLLHDAARALAALARGVAEQLGMSGPVVVGGGLRRSHLLVGALRSEARRAGLAEPTLLATEPLRGTLHLADRLPPAG